MAFEQRLVEMWYALPVLEDETLPRRSKVKTAYISSMLPNCWQLNWQAGNKLIIEYEGDEVDAMWGDRPIGQDFLANYSEARRTALLSFYSQLFETPCGASITREIQKGRKKFTLATHFVPMLSNDGERRIIFGTSEMGGNFKDTEGRLDFDNATVVDSKFLNLGHGLPQNAPFQ